MPREELDPALTPDVEKDPVVAALAHAPGKIWGWILAYGIFLLVLGLLILTNPIATGVATGIIVGITLLLYGGAAIAAGFTSMAHRGRWVEIALGVLALVAGLFALFNPVVGALSLVWAIGAWLAIAGVLQIAWALKARHDKGWRLFMGALDLVLGLVLLFSSPATGLAFLAVILMISFAVRGVFLIVLALGMRKVGNAVRSRL
ncbi:MULTISPECIES: HdeD family acid-resistance protein [Novosphingobium]|uniref:DUF308 domain-containing protein n=1 Tax=Novosphingobium decolorationis TaxID=2698673 RepID=A0ABX8ECH8_9SPHN|nr:MULTISPECIES: DUF308 domain-containing protein [Novosphingobium]QVM85841.1 DUF308 domain-containing protein [Novosphingobium decolorationis]GAM07206.1 hypothetical conserved protein [Novosphingobium sp. MBES04]